MLRHAQSFITVLALLCMISPLLAEDASGLPEHNMTAPSNGEQNEHNLSSADIVVKIQPDRTDLKPEYGNINTETNLHFYTGNGKNAPSEKLEMKESTTWIRPNFTKITQTLGCRLQDAYENVLLFFYKLTAAKSRETHGQMGGVWYRFWETSSDHDLQLDEKTIAKAIHMVLHNLGGVWRRDEYCIIITSGDTWVGSLLIGATPQAMREFCDSRFHGNYDILEGQLEWPYGGGMISQIKNYFSG